MLNAQRGQTMPFWLLATALAAATMLFVGNFVTMTSWQIHAQNAADSAAAVALSPTANVLNEESTLLYGATIAEYRARYLNQGLLNAINGIGCGSNCAAVYARLLPAYNDALGTMNEAWQELQKANNFTQGGQQVDERSAIAAMGSFDPSFSYTVLATPAPMQGRKTTGARSVDVVACKTMSYFAPSLFGLGSTTYQVIGRAAASATPVVLGTSSATHSETFSPSSTNPVTGQAYQLNEDPGATGLSTYYTVDFSSLSVGLDWYSSAAIKPYARGSGAGGAVQAGDYAC